MTTGILLINLGTPDAPTTPAVRRYLCEFLMDERVVDLPRIARTILVKGIIIPFRARNSAHAYQAIWTDQGSPLLLHSEALKAKLADRLSEQYCVALGMRYGAPAIELAVTQLAHCEKIIVIPLFPQYSSAATGSAMQRVMDVLSRYWNVPDITMINQFYNHAGFIHAYADIILTHKKPDDFLLMSYHGLPERHIQKSHCLAECHMQAACPRISEKNNFCYRAQCYETSRLLAQTLQLSADQYAVSFQSRLGKIPWIKPYTDLLLPELFQKGILNLSVVCPSFVADCSETLEEIGIRLRAQWQALGGQRFTLIPCLNDEGNWVNTLVVMIQQGRLS